MSRDGRLGGTLRFVVSLIFAMLSGMELSIDCADAGGVARLSPSGDSVEVEYLNVDGMQRDSLPLYREGAVRYFSVGIGLDERGTDYPPFALKLVFTAGGKPYLTGVTVTIQGGKDGEKVVIPGERVTGPWLFVDVPLAHIIHEGS